MIIAWGRPPAPGGLPRLTSYTALWKGRCRLAELAGMLSGVAHATPASMKQSGSSACVVACSVRVRVRVSGQGQGQG